MTTNDEATYEPAQSLARRLMSLAHASPSVGAHVMDAVSEVVALLLDEIADGGVDTTGHPARLLVLPLPPGNDNTTTEAR